MTYTGAIYPKEMRGIPFEVEEERQKRVCERCGKIEDEKI